MAGLRPGGVPGPAAGKMFHKLLLGHRPCVVIALRVFAPKVAQFCAHGDTICNGAPVGGPSIQHAFYAFNGMMDAASDFVVRRL